MTGDHDHAGVLRGTARPLAEEYDTALLDLDGVVYLGARAVPTAVTALEKARAEGMRAAFVTNNAARTPGAVAARLVGLGVSARADDVVTSAQAAARLVAERVEDQARVLVVGGMGLRHAIRMHGLRPVTTADDDPAAVVQGFAPDLSYGLIAEGALAVARGALFVASNADVTLPTPRGMTPGNGSLLQVIRTATGRDPLVAGKPEPPLHREAVLRTGARRPLVVGDRLDTDIEGAVRAGVDSMLVLTGVTDAAALIAAPPRRRPTYLAPDLSGLLSAHPAARGTAGTGTCRGWTVRCRDGGLDVSGDGDPYDGLRAACAAVWSAGVRVEPAAVAAALHRIGVPNG